MIVHFQKKVGAKFYQDRWKKKNNLKSMKNTIILLAISIITINCSINRKNYPTSLKGQKWTWARSFSGQGMGYGNELTFTSNTSFIEKYWYSGGAYWTKTYSGIYYYDEKAKTVFLKYDKNSQLRLIKSSRKKAIQLIDVNSKLMPRFYDNWKLENNQLKTLKHKEIATDSLVIIDLKETFKFKIETEALRN